MAEVIINNVKVTLIRRYNQRGPWRNEYYFRGNWGLGTSYTQNLMGIILPYHILLSKGQLEYITKMLSNIYGLNRAKKGRKPKQHS